MDQKRVTRKLRAILSADVQGYSRLMGDDEVSTFKTITEYREVFSSLVTQYNGRVVDSPGDNILSEFASVVDAVQCAVEIQKVLKAKNEGLPENRRMIFRMGVNLGDVIHEDDRIYGDGVNIAARIESLAEGGGICISGSAYEQIENKLALGYNFIGEHSVKNIARPIRVYKVPMDHKDVGKKEPKPKFGKNAAIAVAVVLILAIAAMAVWKYHTRPTPTKALSKKTPVTDSSGKSTPLPLPDKPSIAVLPFANIGGDPKEDYLSDGITEQIITALSKTPRLFVIARNSTFAFKGKFLNVSQIGQELGVRYVLEGSVQKSGNQLRITAQLIDAKTGAHLWAEKYDKEFKDIFALQDEITLNVLSSLQVHLGDGEDAHLWAKGTNNLEAYIKFLQGLRYYHQISNKESYLVKAPKMLEQAITLDPQFPTPYFILAMIHRWSPFFDSKIDPKQALKLATEFLQKGMKLDPNDPLAHSALGLIYQAQGKNQEAISEAEEAILLEPNMAEAYWLLGVNLQYEGRYEDAIAQIKKAIRLNPIPPPYYYMFLGNAYQLMGKYQDSIVAYKKAIHISPNYIHPHMRLAISYGLLDREKDAHAEAKEVLRINPKFSGEHFLKVASYKNKSAKDLLRKGLLRAGLVEPPKPIPEKPSIAVLPFTNISGDPKEDYLSDGITEQIITALSKTPKSSVIARNSVFTYKGKPVKVQEVAKDLGVRYVLEGSVQKSGKRLRITAQLIDAKTGNHLWAEKYDRELKDIFELQDDITKNVITALQVQLTDGETARIYGGDTKNVEAFLKVVKGRHHVLRLNRDDNLIARKLYEEAIRLDPKYSRAYTALGWTYWHDGHQKWTDAPTRAYEKALEMGQKAHSLDAADSGPLMLLAWVHASMGHPGKALEAATKGISLEPHLSEACWCYGGTLRYIGRFKEAIPWIEKGTRLDPIPPWWSMAQLAYCYYELADNEKVFDVLNRALVQNPRIGYFHALRSLTLLHDGKPHEALSAIIQARSLLPQITRFIGTHAEALHATGNSDEALALMEDSVRNHPDDPDALRLFGQFLGLLGRHEEGTLMAEKAVQLRPGPMTRLFLGRQYVVSGQYKKAIFELKEASRPAPDRLQCHIWLAAAWSLSDDMKKARAEIAEVHRLNPDYSLECFRRDCYNAYPPEDRNRIMDALERAGLK